MLETYKVGVTLEMGGNVLTSIDRIIAQLEALDRRVKDTGTSFGRLATDIRAVGTAGKSIGQLNRAMEKLGTGGAGKAVTDLDRMAAATKAVVTASERLSTVLRDNARLAADTAKAMEAGARAAAPRAAGQAGAAAGRAHGRGRFSSHDGMMLGMGASMVGQPMVHGAETALERGMEVAHLRTQILADVRVTPAVADQMVTRAYDATASAPGTRVAGNLHALIDLKNVTGSLEEAEALLPRFARLTALLAVVDKKRGGDGAFAAAKAMELMGGMIDERQDASGHTVREINPELMQKRLDMMARVAVATNGRVAPQDFLGFAKQARVAGMTLTDEFIYEKLPAIMMGMGGPRAGTALMSMAQVFEGGKLTNKSMEALQEIGLASAGGITTERGRHGKKKDVVHPEAIYDLDVMRHDPSKWIEAAQKRMEAAGIHGTEAQIVALMKASQRSTIAGMLADLLKDAPVIAKEQANIVNTKPDVAAHFAQQDPAAKLQQMQAAFDKLMTTLGSAAMDDAVKLMNAVTSGLNGLADWAGKNPTMARLLVDVGGGLGAVAVGLGTLTTAIFMFAPALKLLGMAGGGGAASAAAAAGGATATAGGALGLASRLALGGAAAGIGTALVLGSEYETAATRASQESLARQRRFDPMQTPSDGYGVDGRRLTAPPIQSSGMQVNLHGDFNADGRKIGEIAAKGIARAGSAPSMGTTGPDIRIGTFGGLGGIN